MSSEHLSNKEIFSIVIQPGAVDKDREEHFEGCLYCQKRLKSLTDFTESFRRHIEPDELSCSIQKKRILSAISEHHRPLFQWKWAMTIGFTCFILLSALIFKQLHFNNEIVVSERDLLDEIQTITDFSGNIELPQRFVYLCGYEAEEFHSFLKFFSSIEEEDNEEEDIIDDISGIIGFKQCIST